jgi:hypothetical protein
MSRYLLAVCLLLSLLGWVSSPARGCSPSRAKLVSVTYPVADLVVPVDRSPVVITIGQEAKAEQPSRKKAAATTEEALIKLITSTISPNSWGDMGGPGTIDYFPLTMTLVINQTPQINEEVAHLLSALRRQQDVQVSAEIRFVCVPESFCERQKVDVKAGSPKMLTAKEMSALVEKVQAEPETNIMAAPKLTMMSGQQATFSIVHEGNAIELCLKPTVSADRRLVRTNVSLAWKNGSSSGKDRAMVTIPDGGAMVLAGWTERRVAAHEERVPVLGDIPYLSRFFKTVSFSSESFRVLVLVTPRVIVVPEEEDKAPVAALDKKHLAPPGGGEEGQEPATLVGKVEELVQKYHQACAAGDLARAKKLARKALHLDPACFGKDR